MVEARSGLKGLALRPCFCYGRGVSRSLVFRKGALHASCILIWMLAIFQIRAQAPAIQSEPADITVYEGQEARFTVVATGTAPLSYQWQRDGADLPIEHTATLILVAPE